MVEYLMLSLAPTHYMPVACLVLVVTPANVTLGWEPLFPHLSCLHSPSEGRLESTPILTTTCGS